MKQLFTLCATVSLVLFFILGCNWFSSNNDKSKNSTNSNKSITDQVSEQIFGTEKTGIPECDELFDKIEKQAANNNSDSITEKMKREAIRQVVLAKIRENTSNASPQQKQEIAAYCKKAISSLTSTSANSNK
jgi:hypothetical protein